MGLWTAYRLSSLPARLGGVTTALYRRYRPETFADVIGQEHVTEPLMQALRTQRVGHAYLFSGPRGCGKTTSARILARCLNCEQGPTPTPCGRCESCVALARGGPGSVDVIEIDAASHGGVDDARDLRERASYGPAQSRYKVYIIDEAHMVTPQGFNALLKIVEEPPEHVKFVFATTEPEKVIGTIRSRTHHYPFRLVPPAKLTVYLETLAAQEGVAVAPGVLGFVTRAGGGSVRDSLSVLDQLIAGSGPEGLTYEGAAALLGFTSVELLDATIDAIAGRDAAAVFGQIDKVIESGHDPRRFAMDLLERLRDLIIVAAVPDGAAQVLRGVPEDQLDRMRGQQSRFGAGELSRAADIVSTGITEMTGATSPRLQLELICARVLLPAASGEQGYAARLDRLERRLDLAATGSAAHSPEVAAALQRPGMPPTLTRAVAESAPRPVVGPATSPAEPAPAGYQARGPRPAPDRQPAPESRQAPPPGQAAAGHHAPAADGRQVGAPARSAAPHDSGLAYPPAEGPRESGPADPQPATPIAPPSVSRPTAPPVEVVTAPPDLDIVGIRRVWPEVLGRIFTRRRVTWTFVSQHASVLDYDGRRLVLGIATVGLTNTFRAGNHAEVVRQALIDEIGLDVIVEGVAAPRDQPAAAPLEPSQITSPTAQPEPGTPAQSATPQSALAPETPAPATPAPVALAPVTPAPVTPTQAAPPSATHTSVPQAPTDAPPEAPAQVESTPRASTPHPEPTSRPLESPQAARAVREELARAKAATRRSLEERHRPGARHTGADSGGPAGGAAPLTHDPTGPDAAEVSFDDEDVTPDLEMGQAVIERLLGGRILDDDGSRGER